MRKTLVFCLGSLFVSGCVSAKYKYGYEKGYDHALRGKTSIVYKGYGDGQEDGKIQKKKNEVLNAMLEDKLMKIKLCEGKQIEQSQKDKNEALEKKIKDKSNEEPCPQK